MIYSDGSRYEGQFKHGVKHGYGIHFYFDGSTYKGNWAEDKKNGFGVFDHYKYSNQNKEGYWVNDEYIGIDKSGKTTEESKLKDFNIINE